MAVTAHVHWEIATIRQKAVSNGECLEEVIYAASIGTATYDLESPFHASCGISVVAELLVIQAIPVKYGICHS